MSTPPMSWPPFTDAELSCPCGCGQLEMDAGFMTRLEELRQTFGKPLRISSAYRCPVYDMQCSGVGLSGTHVVGQAVDILVSGSEAYHLLLLAMQLGFTGIGVCQKGGHSNRYLHLDTVAATQSRPRPAIWTY
jgi:zinc D-Ala-D-Ala carboxypeptidase